MTDFVIQNVLREAKSVIEAAECVALSERDSLLVLKLLEDPPAPNARLRAAIAAMPKPKRKPGRFPPGAKNRSREGTTERLSTAAMPQLNDGAELKAAGKL